VIYWIGLLENLVVFTATVLVCYFTSSAWGLVCLVGITWVKRLEKDGDK